MTKRPKTEYGSARGTMEIIAPSDIGKTDLFAPGTDTSVLQGMSTEQLRAELARGLTLTADTLARLGHVWAELERRGENLSDLRHGLARTLPLIASGRLAAEAVVAFAGRPSVLRSLEGLAVARQIELAKGCAVQVIDPADPKAIQEMTLDRMPSAALRLVFADGEIRSPEAQRLALRPRRRSSPERAERHWRPIYDSDSGTITVGRMTVRLTDLLSVLAAAAGPDRPPAMDRPDDYLTVKTRLSREEHNRFQALCRRHELPDWEMMRKALRAFGLI